MSTIAAPPKDGVHHRPALKRYFKTLRDHAESQLKSIMSDKELQIKLTQDPEFMAKPGLLDPIRNLFRSDTPVDDSGRYGRKSRRSAGAGSRLRRPRRDSVAAA